MTITGLDDFVNEFAAELVASASEALLTDLQTVAPVGVTGELVASAYSSADGTTATVGFAAPQADYTNLGTHPHEIYPTNANALQFFWPNGPNGPGTYTFDHVNHPGQVGTGWFTDGTDDAAWEAQLQLTLEER